MSQRGGSLNQSFAIFGLVGLWLISSCSLAGNRSQSKQEAKTMKLTSSAFINNGLIPPKYTCDGADISPPLSWDEIPSETQSLALIVDDLDAPARTFVHWVIYDISPTVNQLPEKIIGSKTIPSGGVQGKNDFGRLGYGGLCPPSGIHRYFFQLYALDQKLSLATGASKSQIISAMEGHILEKAELIGRYQRQH